MCPPIQVTFHISFFCLVKCDLISTGKYIYMYNILPSAIMTLSHFKFSVSKIKETHLKKGKKCFRNDWHVHL